MSASTEENLKLIGSASTNNLEKSYEDLEREIQCSIFKIKF